MFSSAFVIRLRFCMRTRACWLWSQFAISLIFFLMSCSCYIVVLFYIVNILYIIILLYPSLLYCCYNIDISLRGRETAYRSGTHNFRICAGRQWAVSAGFSQSNSTCLKPRTNSTIEQLSRPASTKQHTHNLSYRAACHFTCVTATVLWRWYGGNRKSWDVMCVK